MRKIGKNFTWKFIGYFSAFYLLINIAVIGLFLYFILTIDDEVISSDLHFETTANMQTLVHLDGKKTTISKDLQDVLKRNESILLIRDSEDKIIKTFNADEKIENLSWYYAQDLTTWSLTPEYQAVLIDRKPIVKASELFDLRKMDELKNYMDANGLGLFKQSIDRDALTKMYGPFSVKEVENHWFKDKNGDNFNPFIFRETMRDNTYYLFVSENHNARDKRIIFEEDGFLYDKDLMNSLKTILIWYVGFSLLIMFCILAIALLVGNRLTRPLIHFIKWVEALRHGHYLVPEDPRIYKNGKMRRKYRMYNSVDQSIRELTKKLETDKNYQNRISSLRDEWVAGISHDIKTPLSSIYGYSKLLNSDLDIDCTERKKFAEIIEDKAMYIDALLKDLNMTYQLKNNVLEFNKTPEDIVEYIETFILSFNHKRLSYVNRAHALVMIDVERMNRVLTNIVSNAFTHNDDNDELDVWMNTKIIDRHVVIEIADNGKGIDEKELPYIFNRYYRGTNTKSDSAGSGLGLAVAKQIVESHEGKIEVTSSLAGTVFLIYLPIVSKY